VTERLRAHLSRSGRLWGVKWRWATRLGEVEGELGDPTSSPRVEQVVLSVPLSLPAVFLECWSGRAVEEEMDRAWASQGGCQVGPGHGKLGGNLMGFRNWVNMISNDCFRIISFSHIS
jgi:hypothetical protein